MFWHPAHQDLIRFSRHPHRGITCQTVPKGHIGIKLCSVLIKDSRDQVCALLDLALVRLKLTHQKPQHCGFTDPVRTNKRDAIPALEAAMEELDARMAANTSDYELLAELQAERGEKEAELDAKLERWMELEELAEG